MKTILVLLCFSVVSWNAHAWTKVSKEEFLKVACETKPKHCALLKSLNLQEEGTGGFPDDNYLFKGVSENGELFRVEYGAIRNGAAVGIWIQ